MYTRKCPKCGSRNLASSVTWDIVTDQFCEDCGWSKNYGYVEGSPGDHYLVASEDHDYDEDCYCHNKEEDLEFANFLVSLENVQHEDDDDNGPPF